MLHMHCNGFIVTCMERENLDDTKDFNALLRKKLFISVYYVTFGNFVKHEIWSIKLLIRLFSKYLKQQISNTKKQQWLNV